MFAVTVTLEITACAMKEFMPLLKANSEASLRTEEGCLQFDICTDKSRPNEVFLYELYSDMAAFQKHLETSHYKSFDIATNAMITGKSVQTYEDVIQ